MGQPAAKAPSVAPPPHTMPMAQMATTPTPTSSLMPEFNTGQENATKVFCKYGPSDYNAVEMEALAELERSTSSVTVDAALQKIGALDADGFHPRRVLRSSSSSSSRSRSRSSSSSSGSSTSSRRSSSSSSGSTSSNIIRILSSYQLQQQRKQSCR